MRGLLKNLSNRVEEAGPGSFANDYSFQGEAVRIFNKLYDAHTQYRLPLGYQNGTFIRPVSLRLVQSGPGQRRSWVTAQNPMGVAGEELYQELFGIDIRALYNKTVEKIDGIPVEQYVRIAADQFFTLYKDPQVRFNALIRQRGWAFVPLQTFVLDQFPPTTTLNDDPPVPNFIFYAGGLRSQWDLWRRNNCSHYCMDHWNQKRLLASDTAREAADNVHEEKEEVYREVLREMHRRRPAGAVDDEKFGLPAAPFAIKIIATDRDNQTQFSLMAHPTKALSIPILRVRTFRPSTLS